MLQEGKGGRIACAGDAAREGRGAYPVRTTVTIRRRGTMPIAAVVATVAMEARLFPHRRHRRCDGSRGMLGGLRRGRGLPGRALVLQEAGGRYVAGWAGRGASPAAITAITPARRRRKIRPRRRIIPQRLAAVEAVPAAVVTAAPQHHRHCLLRLLRLR